MPSTSRDKATDAPRTHTAPHCSACLFPQRSAVSQIGRGRRPRASLPLPSGHCASPHPRVVQECPPDCLSVAFHCVLRPRLTSCGSPVLENPPPSSALGAFVRVVATTTEICTAGASTRAHACASPPPARPPTTLSCVRNRLDAGAPSIFGTRAFGWYVATHFLADDDFYAYCPAVPTHALPSWFLCASLRCLIRTRGSSPVARPAYRDAPTRRPQSWLPTLLRCLLPI